MADSVDKLSDLTGVKRADMLSIMAQIKANHARLDACAQHHFEPIEATSPPRARYRCLACAGEIDGIAYLWYKRGLEHGKLS